MSRLNKYIMKSGVSLKIDDHTDDQYAVISWNDYAKYILVQYGDDFDRRLDEAAVDLVAQVKEYLEEYP